MANQLRKVQRLWGLWQQEGHIDQDKILRSNHCFIKYLHFGLIYLLIIDERGKFCLALS